MPIYAKQENIRAELRLSRKLAGRRINIINLEEPYPANLEMKCKLRDHPPPKEKNQVKRLFEMWGGLLPTCVDNSSSEAGGRLDVRDPSSAMQVADDYSNL